MVLIPGQVYTCLMQQTYSSRLEYETGRFIDEAVAELTNALSNGSCHDIAAYKFVCGQIRGLLHAKELMAEADRIIQSGERG